MSKKGLNEGTNIVKGHEDTPVERPCKENYIDLAEREEIQGLVEVVLMQNSIEFQQIMALYELVYQGGRSTFSEIKRNALEIIDVHFDIYRQKFSLPDRLVSLPVECEDGHTYYLTLDQGYLCFIQNPEASKRAPLWLAKKCYKIDKTRVN